MAEYIFGANILENLTTGMYKNSQVIFREYIQNSCDAIDKAISRGILADGEGKIDIWIEEDTRRIFIEDNGTGIAEKDFAATLQSIAQSDKKIDTEKGFRGIGRLCGLAYCRELIFSTTAKGEDVISVMRIDAQKLRSHFYGTVKYTAQEVLDDVIDIEKIFDGDKSEHWFKVELIDINAENEVLLDVKFICDYLSFVAPVEYKNKFYFYSKIYEHAKELNFKIDEYQITLNSESLVKNYKTNFNYSKGEDEIFDLSFRDFYDDIGNLIAWCWIGLSKFKGVIEQSTKYPNNKMRSIRLRKGNIQIGDADVLQNLFSEERGIHYFIGEMFAADKDLIPNSQRDYFVENSALRKFETVVQNYFEELKKIYYGASDINSAKNSIKKFEKASEEFERKQQNNLFIDEDQRNQIEEELNELEKKANTAKKKIERAKQNALDTPETILSKVVIRITAEKPPVQQGSPKTAPVKNKKGRDCKFRAQNLSKLSKNERKIVQKIYNIILNNTDGNTSEMLIGKIEEELK